MHIHLPLVLEAIFFSWIALYWIIYKILLRKKLSPLLASLIANSNYGFMKVRVIGQKVCVTNPNKLENL